MLRRLIPVTAAALTLVATACVPPGPGGGKPTFDAWASTHITVIHADLSAILSKPCGVADIPKMTVYIDDACLARTDPSGFLTQFTLYHEFGHIVDATKLGFARGVTPPIHLAFGDYYVSLEQSAQCVAEAVLGYSAIPPEVSVGLAQTLGYWSCGKDAPSELARIRAAMITIGIL